MEQTDQPVAKQGLRGKKLVAVIAGVAVASLLAGAAVMQFIVSPAELAARTEAPEPGPVTASVEMRTIENTVITRGEIGYADPVAVQIDAGGSENVAIITGRVPTVGTVLEAGSIALEVAGRPVIVLPGDLPAYRSLKAGMRGPDVLQLKQALVALGYGVGDPASDLYDYNTAAAVAAMYQQLGYAPADGGKEARRAARDAERALHELQQAEEPDLVAIQDAQEELWAAQEEAMVYLPSSEVVFLKGLPLRVDEVLQQRGDTLTRSPMTVTGASLSITGSVSKQDAELLQVGQTASFSFEGKDYTATITKISAPGTEGNTDSSSEQSDSGASNNQTASSRYKIELTPGELTDEEFNALRGNNFRLRIPLASTGGDVLAVPIAALSAGSGGEDRVELLLDMKNGADAETEIIQVETGLAADGYVEIKSTDERLKAGAKVVVGR